MGSTSGNMPEGNVEGFPGAWLDRYCLLLVSFLALRDEPLIVSLKAG